MNKRFVKYYVSAGIAFLTLVVYLPALNNDFVIWDDDIYILYNQHLRSFDWGFIRWAFADTATLGYWSPLTLIVYGIDYALWGLNPFGYHLANILLHAAVAFVVVHLIMRLIEARNASHPSAAGPVQASGFNGQSGLVAAGVAGMLFGIHPIHVESVAWISETKDVLYSLFYLLSIIAYAKYACIPEQDRPGGWAVRAVNRHYAASLGLFVLALASKPTAVTLPVVLLVLDWYPFRRIRSFPAFLKATAEKMPFLVCSGILSIATVKVQLNLDAMAPLNTLSFDVRILMAFRALIAYVGKILYPVDLIPFYPYPKSVSLLEPAFFLAIGAAVGATVAVLALAKKHRMYAAVWAFYGVTVFPMLGLFQSGLQAMADRFVYLPSLGFFVLAGIGAELLWEKTGSLRLQGIRLRTLLASAAAVLIVTLSFLTVKQTAIWENTISLWSSVISGEPDGFAGAYTNRGTAFKEAGQFEKALRDYDKAIELLPGFEEPFYNRGMCYAAAGRFDRAITDYSAAISQNPFFTKAYLMRASALKQIGWFGEAIKDYDAAAALSPAYSQLYLDRGELYLLTGDRGRAFGDFQKACDGGIPAGCAALEDRTKRKPERGKE